jgi:hypothetical protein
MLAVTVYALATPRASEAKHSLLTVGEHHHLHRCNSGHSFRVENRSRSQSPLLPKHRHRTHRYRIVLDRSLRHRRACQHRYHAVLDHDPTLRRPGHQSSNSRSLAPVRRHLDVVPRIEKDLDVCTL